jgi:hypothetical protein
MAEGSLPRRGFLGVALGMLAAGCASVAPAAAPVLPAEAPPPPLRVPDLARILPLAGLRWVILARPREIAAIPWLIPPIGVVAPEENLGRFAAAVGFDLRQVQETAVAAYAEEGGDAMLYAVRHNGDPVVVERLFRARLTTGEHRALDRPDLVRLSGKIGRAPATLAILGRDVAAFQFGGSPARGPARVAALYATDKLKRSPTVLSEDPLRALDVRLGPAPFRAFAVGPFEGELARGARGLLAGATAIGGTIRPSAREGLLLVIAVAGDFSRSAEPASRELTTAWGELAAGSFGRLMGLDQPVEPPLATHADDAVAVAVELDPGRLAKGIAAATSARIEEIMR